MKWQDLYLNLFRDLSQIEINSTSCILPFLILIRFAMIWSLISLKTRRSFPVFDNLSRKYQIVFRSGNFSGYPRKLRNDIRSLISRSNCGSERLYHFYEKSSMMFMSSHPRYLSFSHLRFRYGSTPFRQFSEFTRVIQHVCTSQFLFRSISS